MKKIIFLLAIVLLAVQGMAQERTVNLTIPNEGTYINYTGASADTLIATNQDTLDIVVRYNGPGYVRKVAVKSRFDVIAGADTTVSVSVFGKEFSDDATYVEIIAAANSSAVTANNVVQILTSDWTEVTATFNSTVAAHTMLTDTTGLSAYPADSTVVPSHVIANAAQTVTPPDKSYRYFRVRYIINGDDNVGTGILLDDFEFKVYTD